MAAHASSPVASRTRRLGATALLWTLAGLCVAAVALALLAQYRFGMRPCPWCTLQRAIYIILAILFALAACVKPAALRRSVAALGLLICGTGITSAIYQHHFAAQEFSCNLTLADKILKATKLSTALPEVFMPTASCANAAVSVLGIPFAYWSLGLFALLLLGSAWVLRRPT